MLAIKNCLMSEIPNTLSLEKICSLDDKTKTKIAEGFNKKSKEQKKLELEVKYLKSACDSCQSYASRHCKSD